MNEEWHPHVKQEFALVRNEFEVLYGGARGGGKTDTGLVWLTYDIDNPKYRALVIRKNSDDLSDWIDRAAKFYKPLGASIAYRPAIIKFPWGAVIRTGHLKDNQAYTKYQGHEYQRILIEELTQIPDEKRYLQLISSCRSTIPELKPHIFLTTNPGGIGHGWVKSRFVDPEKPNTPFKDKTSGRSRIYIPATIDDNPTLIQNDPDYIRQLDALKDNDVDLWKAWRLGSWDVFAGQFFRNFRRDLHTIPSYYPTNEGFLIAGLDWGRVDNFSFHVSHVFPVTFGGVTFNRVITFLEVYGNDQDPSYWACRIMEKLEGKDLKIDSLTRVMSDNQIFAKTPTDNGITIADQFYQESPDFNGKLIAASKNRIGGWESIQKWLSIAPDGKPYWMITEDCKDLIRTLPAAVHDENRVEDIDQSGEDDALDEMRYQFSDLKWIDAKVGSVPRGGEEQIKQPIDRDKDEWNEDD